MTLHRPTAHLKRSLVTESHPVLGVVVASAKGVPSDIDHGDALSLSQANGFVLVVLYMASRHGEVAKLGKGKKLAT